MRDKLMYEISGNDRNGGDNNNNNITSNDNKITRPFGTTTNLGHDSRQIVRIRIL
jgi:hypothetical protein